MATEVHHFRGGVTYEMADASHYRFAVHFARYRKTETRGLGVRKGVPRTWQRIDHNQ
jgi:hypothetical protein